MTGARTRGTLAVAALFALGVNLFLFALLPAMRTAPSRCEATLRLRPVAVVRLEEVPPTPPAQAPEKPKKQEPLPEPSLSLPLDPSPVHTASAPTLQVGPGLPELDTPAFKPPTGPMVFGEAQLDKLPRLTCNVAPLYPFRAKRLGLSGSVKIEYLVEKNGRVSRIKILGATPPGIFERSVLDAVGKWTFNPGEIAGQAVKVRRTKTIFFDITK